MLGGLTIYPPIANSSGLCVPKIVKIGWQWTNMAKISRLTFLAHPVCACVLTGLSDVISVTEVTV